MKNYLKEKRALSYLIHDWDDRNLQFSFNLKNVPEQVIHFFKCGSELVYPAKSYFVAIIYAKCLQEYFNEDFFNMLSDKELLPDDFCFKTYLEDQKTYDLILSNIRNPLDYKSAQKTIDYFKKEYLIDGVNN